MTILTLLTSFIPGLKGGRMSDTLLGTLIGGIFSLAVCLITNWSNRKKDAVIQAKREQKLDDKISEMSRKLEEHNGLADKISVMEKSIVRIEAIITPKG